MWLSEETASWFHGLANAGLILGLIIGVVSTFIVVWMGNVKEEYLKRDLAAANERASKAELQAADANQKAESERFERIKLEASIAPRSLTLEQQNNISELLRPFAGKKVRVITYSLDAVE